MEERKSIIKKENRQSHQVSIEELDEVMLMLGKGLGSYPNYNVQVNTDTKTQLITSCEVVEDRNDEKQFIRQWLRTEKNIGSDPSRKYIADSGCNAHSITEKA